MWRHSLGFVFRGLRRVAHAQWTVARLAMIGMSLKYQELGFSGPDVTREYVRLSYAHIICLDTLALYSIRVNVCPGASSGSRGLRLAVSREIVDRVLKLPPHCSLLK
jgi:hypothetical protein